MFVRTVNSVKMNGLQIWLLAVTLHMLVLTAGCAKHHRRSMASQGGLPVSKGGWRPVIGSSGLLYSSLGTAPLHAPAYKIPVVDLYQSSARPVAVRDVAKLTSIAQSYRPTTLRTVSSAAPSQVNQPINSYLNPFALPNNGFSHFKYVQSFPIDNVFTRNPHNPYSFRPALQKHPNKVKQASLSGHNNLLHQLTSIQPIQFGQYQTAKPLDLFGKPVDSYGRPVDSYKRPESNTEIFKPEVFKVQDAETAQQQEVKTAQQQTFGGSPNIISPLANYAFQDSVFPPSILGTFGSFGLQTVKGRDPVFPSTKSTYSPSQSPQPAKQTIFNSFSYTNNFKSTPGLFSVTTPKHPTNNNNFQFGSTLNDYRNVPTSQTKISKPVKTNPNANGKGIFKASPQDPFIKNIQNFDYNKITTYNPIIPTTTLANTYYNNAFNYPTQQNAQILNYQNQQDVNYNHEKKKMKIQDSVAAGVNQQSSQQFAEPPKTQVHQTPAPHPHRGTYEVTEAVDNDLITHSSPSAWVANPGSQSYNNFKTSEESISNPLNFDAEFGKLTTTHIPQVTEEFFIVTESEKGYENSLGYDGQVESQSRRPLGDIFEPIEKHKLKDYYYQVSTSSYEDQTETRRTKKPSETTKLNDPEVTTQFSNNKEINDIPIETLPTLPPNRHFKRPSTPQPLDKDRIRKRNKLRRRRPGLAHNNRNREETTTRKLEDSSKEIVPTTSIATTTVEEIHTIRPRIRPSKLKAEQSFTTPSVTTDFTTSALPTVSPTVPTVVKKKLGHRRPLTTPIDRIEVTTFSYRDYGTNKESPIMKISTRPQSSRLTSSIYEYKANETPNYSHKEDEKDTPTSDVSVSLTDTLKTSSEAHKEFSFHRDVKPVDVKESTTDNGEYNHEETTVVPIIETTPRTPGKVQRLKLKTKVDRPKFSVKEYRSRLSSTTSTTEKTIETNTPKLRFPQRKAPYIENQNAESENVTERKRFTPKDPRHKYNKTENVEQIEREIHSTRQPGRQRQTTVNSESATQKISSRVRNGLRKPRPTEETAETSSPTTVYSKRLLRKKIKDSETGESVQDISVTETTMNYDQRSEITSERTRSESAIMKIADKKHHDRLEHIFEHSKRVSDLTLAASKDYNNPGMFKTVSGNSRRIPSYFTIATDDPILPIEAFFPQLNQKKGA